MSIQNVPKIGMVSGKFHLTISNQPANQNDFPNAY